MNKAKEWAELAKQRPSLRIFPGAIDQQGLNVKVRDDGWVSIYYSTPTRVDELNLPPQFAQALGRFLTATYAEECS